jgi:aryl-alcohol dehydrogenase-like predicted oxidoreductase
MKKRLLGKTGIEVSEIAFGGVEIGIPYGIGMNSPADMLPEQEAIRLLHAATDSGINFFDTARMYGNSERIMGKAFTDRRDRVVLSTKCRHLRNQQGILPSGRDLHHMIRNSLHESLEALQTDYIDIFMLHQADLEILTNGEISNIFTELKKEGRCRATGVSTYTPKETQKVIETKSWDTIQLPFNLMDQRQQEFFKTASEMGIGIVVRSVLLKGLLSDRGKNLHPALIKVEEHLASYHELMEATGYNLPTLAAKFALSFPGVTAVLVGIDRMEYLDQSLKAADGTYLNAGLLDRARQMAYPDPGFLNLPYWDKMNWLK